MENLIKILIVEDEMIIAAKTSMQLSEPGYVVTGILSRGDEVVAHVKENKEFTINNSLHRTTRYVLLGYTKVAFWKNKKAQDLRLILKKCGVAKSERVISPEIASLFENDYQILKHESKPMQ